MLRQYELVEKVKAFIPSADEDLLNKAYIFSMKAHGNQLRKSGEPYFGHPVEVAGILADFGTDVATICTALLHDTLEDTDTTFEDLERLFGSEIASMVDAVTKLSKYSFRSETKEEKSAENFRKLILAAADDIRVLMVKLADRVHNMRTLQHTSTEQQFRIAKETMEIYAPLAERIGMHEFKTELENLALKYFDPKAWQDIHARLDFYHSRGDDDIIRIKEGMEEILTAIDLDFSIKWRIKEPYSIWKKMQAQKVNFSDIWDIVGFRIFVTTEEDCYRCLWALHTSRYRFRTGRFRDFISNPKPNGYQSLHTSLIGPRKERLEVQIRTHEMNEIAEHGIAAHWRYKQNGRPHSADYTGLRSLVQIMRETTDTQEILEHTRMEMFRDQMFCFTPKGDIMQLRRGALVIDFAYAIHSAIGDECVGAYVDGKHVHPLYQLQDNQVVEIITQEGAKPNANWIELAQTGSARSGIRRFWRLIERSKYSEIGHSMLYQTFHHYRKTPSEAAIKRALRHFNLGKSQDLFSAIGKGELDTHAVLWFLYPDTKTERHSTHIELKESDQQEKLRLSGRFKGSVTFSNCCHPIPGDRIVGISSLGEGMNIHTIDCEQLANFDITEAPKVQWIDITWSDDSEIDTYTARLKLTIADEIGALYSITEVLAKMQINVEHLALSSTINNHRSVLLDIHVHSQKHLYEIRDKLEQLRLVTKIQRPRGMDADLL